MTIRSGLWLLAAALVFGLGFHFGGLKAEATLSAYKATAEKAIAAAAKAETAASERAREAEKAGQERADRLAEAYERDKTNAQESADKLASDLRAGNVRLHNRWQACIATDRLSEAARAASQSDDAARDREASAGRVVAAARAADDQIKRLQEFVREVTK